MKKIVIALGGNAILKKGEKPTTETQAKNTKKALEKLFPAVGKNKVVITHGNGPQVGYLLMQQNAPLDVLDAETEGQIGYLIQQNLQNLFRKNNIKKNIATILTQVLVDDKDESFKNPTKFVGQFYTKKEAKKLKRKFIIKEDFGRGWRRVVPSPKPIEIIESKVIENLLDLGVVVIAAGGGGIPVTDKNGILDGVEAVVDKDLASACLANSIKADELWMITDIDKVYLNYRRKGEIGLKKVGLDELKKYFAEGHFPAGSMGPKIEAAIEFLSSGGKRVLITDIWGIGRGRGTEIFR